MCSNTDIKGEIVNKRQKMKLFYKKLLLSTVAALSLTACGGTGDSSDGDKPNSDTSKENIIQQPESKKSAKAQLGVLAGATVKIEELGQVPYKLLYTETTSSGSTVEEIGNFDAHYEALEDDKFYLYTVSNGLDMDANDDGEIDAIPTVNRGSFHAIVQGKSLKEVKGEFKVTTASELVYKKVKTDINETDSLEDKLNKSAKEIFTGDVNNTAILQYNPVEDKNLFHTDYQDKLPEIIKDIHEDRVVADKQVPTCNAGQDKSIIEGESVRLSAFGIDMDGSIVRYVWREDGEIVSQKQYFYYTPTSLGVHTLTLTVTDDDKLEASDRVRITVVEKANSLPSAKNVSYSVDEDSSVHLVLEGEDSDKDILTYKVVVAPVYGTLSGEAPYLSYTPNPDFHGDDRFIYVANDGKADSKKALVILHVNSINDKPVINPLDTIMIKEDTPKTFKLSAKDSDGDVLVYEVTTPPVHGYLSHNGLMFTYTPEKNFSGSDSFSIKSNDGTNDSDEVTIMIDVAEENDAPIVQIGGDRSIVLGNELTLDAQASDVDGKIVSYDWFEEEHQLSTEESFSYKPSKIGSHIISVTVTDDKGATSTGRVLITVSKKPNTPPKAMVQSIPMDEDTTKAILLKGSDDENDTLHYVVTRLPLHGTLSGQAPNLIYAPNRDYFGDDSFEFKINDGKDDSDVVRVSIMIADVKEIDITAPVITLNGAKTLRIAKGEKYQEFGASAKDDVDGVVSTFREGTVDTTTVGTYTITYSARDKAGNITITKRVVTVFEKPNTPPTALSKMIYTQEAKAIKFVLEGSDADKDDLTYKIVSQPLHGTLSGVSPNLSYTPNKDYFSEDRIAFVVNDGKEDSSTGYITIEVSNTNDKPKAFGQTIALNEDTTKAITLTASDIDADHLTFSIIQEPQHGLLSGDAPNLSYTPKKDYFGTDSFVYRVSDGTASSQDVQVDIMIKDMPDDGSAVVNALSKEIGVKQNRQKIVDIVDNSTLSYIITSFPKHGTLQQSKPNPTYIPDMDYVGADSFSYKVNNGTTLSDEATITMYITEYQMISRKVDTDNDGTIDTTEITRYNIEGKEVYKYDSDRGYKRTSTYTKELNGTITKISQTEDENSTNYYSYTSDWKLLKSVTHSVYNNRYKGIYTRILTYDQHGNELTSYANGEFPPAASYEHTYSYEYEYDAYGNIVKKGTFYNGELRYVSYYTFDENNNLTDDGRCTYTYNWQGNIIEKYCGEKDYERYTYADDGKTLMRKDMETSVGTSMLTYDYDDQGRKILEVHSQMSQNYGNTIYTYKYTYSDNGDTVYESIYEKDGQPQYHHKSYIKYDAHGNPTKSEYDSDNDGTIDSISFYEWG